MKHRLLLAAALALSLGHTVPAHAADRAVWAWEATSQALVEDPLYADDAISFLKARGIGTVYLYTDAYLGRSLLTERPDLYRALIARMHAAGIRVQALLGSGHLNSSDYVRPERRKIALSMFQAILDYNRASDSLQRFDGINLDIEPHLLDDWDSNRESLLRQFLDLGRSMMDLKHKSGLDLPVGPSIPFWYDEIPLSWKGATKPASEHLIDLYDYTALMDYRDTAPGPDGIIEHARSELDYAARRGKRVVIGVEIAANEIPKVTFDDNTEAQLELALAQTEEAYLEHPGFGGFALHHLDAYVRWLERQGVR